MTPTTARACSCGCPMSFHNWGTPGFPRIITFAEQMTERCDRCGHGIEGP
jgi:hypothetical protein